MPLRPLPPLEVGQAYRLQEIEYFEYSRGLTDGSAGTLRLHLKNRTTLDLPCSEVEQKRILSALIQAHGDHAIQTLVDLRWIDPPKRPG